MKDSIILFLFLIPTFLFAQYPTGSNKARLGWQTTGDGLIWRGVAGDTVNKPNNRNYPYFQLDTVNAVLYRYIQTRGKWQPVSGSVDVDSLIYATRFWVNSNFFPLQGGTLTGTGGNGFVGFPLQSSPPSTPATGFSLFAGSTGNNISWMQPDGFFRRLVSPVTGTPRQYQFMARSYTLGDSADIANNVTSIAANYLATSNGTNLVARNLFDNNTYVGILNSKPFSLGQWTTAGRPSGTSGYMGWNTTLTGIDWYNGTRWATGLESTFARGTATYFPYFDANGQVTNSILSQSGSEVSVTSSTGILKIDGNNGTNTGQIFFKTGAGDYSNWIGTDAYNMTLRTRTNGQKIVMEFGSSARSFEFRGGGAGNMLIVASTALDLSGINSITSPSFVPLTLISDLGASDVTGLISRRSTRTSDVTNPDRPIHSFQYGTTERARITIAGQLSLGGSAPDASSIVDIVSTARGFLLPRMNTTQRSAITSPASTLLLANTDSLFYEARISGAWKGVAFRDWVRSNFIGSTSTIYGGNGTIGTSRIATLTDSLRFQFGGSDLFRLKSNGVLHVNMPTEASSFVITNTPSENYNNYRGQVFLTGTTSVGDTATGTRRNNHEASFFSGINLVEGGNNVYYDAVSGYGNVIRGNQPKNIVYGTYNTINSGSDNGAYGFGINITGSRVTVFGRETTVTGDDITAIGRGNTITQSNSSIYGSNISGTNLTLHGFGTVTPRKRIDVNGDIIVGDTIYNTSPATHATNDGLAVWKSTALGYALGKVEMKRDTTIYVVDADYDFSAAITTAQIASRYNRVVFWMTTTAAAGSDSDITLHTPDANLMQVEYLIHSVDEAGGFSNKIVFGTNNAVDSTNGLVTNYYPAAGDGIHIRAGLRSGVYKYRYSN